MAGSSETGHDYEAHAESFTAFMGWLKFGMTATAIIVAFVIFLITR